MEDEPKKWKIGLIAQFSFLQFFLLQFRLLQFPRMQFSLDERRGMTARLATHTDATRVAHGNRIVGEKCDDDVGFGGDGLTILEKRAVAPLPDSTNGRRGESTVATDDPHSAHGAIGIDVGGESDHAAGVKIGIGWIDKTQWRTRGRDAAVRTGEREMRSGSGSMNANRLRAGEIDDELCCGRDG